MVRRDDAAWMAELPALPGQGEGIDGRINGAIWGRLSDRPISRLGCERSLRVGLPTKDAPFSCEENGSVKTAGLRGQTRWMKSEFGSQAEVSDGHGMSEVGGIAEVDFGRLEVCL